MAILLHAIVPAEPLPLPEAPLRLVIAGALAAAVADDDPDALPHHERVSQICERVDACLPARFGSRFESDEAVRRVLLEQQERLCAALERVRGKCELAVSAQWVDPPEAPSDATPGRRYLLELLERDRVARHFAEAVRQQAEAAGAQVRLRKAHAELAASVAVLVENERAHTLAEALRSLDVGDSVRILVNGPWPPYSFAEHDQREE